MKQMGWYFDASACIGCKTCEMACKDKNNLPLGVRLRRVREYGGGGWAVRDGVEQPVGVFTYFVSASCMHCQNPPCVGVCPTGAMQKRPEDGIVVVHEDRCIGCGYCRWACPYGAPQPDPASGIMKKCNFCVDLLDQGEQPACVANCPMRCLEFGELEELQRRHGRLDAVEPLPDGHLTRPSIVLTPHRYAQRSGTGTGRVRELKEA